jgi:mxaJ protein
MKNNTEAAPSRRRLGPLVLVALLGVVLASNSTAQDAPGQWEMRICAPPQSLPFSDMNQPGFENRIAEVLADELGAYVTYEWVDFTEDLVNLHFAEGTCDLILGVPDGFGRSLTTIAYYTSPYVMVYRADAGYDIETLDDPELSSLALGVHGAGTPPHTALMNRGLLRNVTRIYGGSAGTDDRLAVLVKAVATGEIDVGFGWGPGTAYWAAQSDVELVVKPIEPLFEPPSIFQVEPITMAVRREDHAFQQALNRAIVERWDDIQATLAEYGVPTVEEPAPFAGEPARPTAETVIDVGVILPVPTGGRTYFAAINDYTGTAAFRGALVAQGLIEAEEDATGVGVVFHYATSPSPEAAARAAERLVSINGVDVLVGGVGEGQADAIAAVADEHEVLFIDVGSNGAGLRTEVAWNRFYIAPSPEDYVHAIVRATRERVGQVPLDWFIVQLDEPGWTVLGNTVAQRLHELGERVVDGIAVERYDPTFDSAYRRLDESGANIVMVLLPATEALVFMGGYQDRGGQALLAPYPDEAAQTRNYLAANFEYGVAVDTPRLLAWDTSLADGRAGDFNSRYMARFGQPADPTAWSTYEALRLLQQAAQRARSDDPGALAEALSNGMPFTTAKGTLAFDEAHQLAGQTLYVVTINPENDWGPTLKEQVAAALLSRTLPYEDPPPLP